jgi:MinD-like ATPase involved in chromosome partitioning or flagellar assembly
VAKIISVHSFRGGTGKSNVTANLAVLVARAGHRVGLIDTDIQSPGIHVLFGLDEQKVRHCLNDYLWGRCKIEATAYDVSAAARRPEDGDKALALFLIPSSLKAGEIARVLRDGYDLGLLNEGFQTLLDRLALDFLFIDTHPGVNEETLLSIAMSDVLLLLLRPDNQDYQGTAVTVELARRLGVREMLLVLNKVPPGMDPDSLGRQVEDVYQTPVVGLLPLSFEIVNLASGAVFCTRYPDHPLTHQLQGIAQRLMR